MRGADEQAITFTDEDAGKVHHPHDDAIVITLLIAEYTTRRVLIDNGSSTNILCYPAFQQMRLGRNQLRPIKFALSKIWRNESTTNGHYYSTYSGRSTTDSQRSKFSCRKLFVFL